MQQAARFRPQSVHLFPPEPGREPLLPTEIASGLVRIEVPLEGPLNFTGTVVMTLNEIAVVGVHHPYEPREIHCGPWVKAPPQNGSHRGQVGYDIRDDRARFFQQRRLHASWSFNVAHI